MPFSTIIAFAQAHRGDDAVRLLLQRHRYPDVDLGLVAQQLEGMAMARGKWPSWAACDGVFYPPRLNREQSSSDATARYKASLLPEPCHTAADLTGGMGVDTCHLARRTAQMHYCEQDPTLCRIASHNFAALQAHNIAVHEGDSMQWLAAQPPGAFDLLYIDPARRNSHGTRVAAFEDCTPDILAHLPLLHSRAARLMVKASPMLDLHTALRQLDPVAEAHIVAVDGECKELLFVSGTAETAVTCVNLRAGGMQRHTFTLRQEREAPPCPIADAPQQYLYEPHAALMKGGCYRLLAQWYGLDALHPSTHLYTSQRLVPGFPGRTFRVLATLPANARAVRQALPEGRAHVVCRNHPLRADLLQQRLHLREGGSHYLIATTTRHAPALLLCRNLGTD